MAIRKYPKIAGNSGHAVLEVALILPLALLLALALYDFSRAMHANNIIANMSREGGNLAARRPLPQQDVMNSLAFTAQPLTMQDNGMMYITVVQGIAGGGIRKISQTGWENSALKNTIKSRFKEEDFSLPLGDGQTATVVEVFYDYNSLFSKNFVCIPPVFRLYSRAVF